MRALLTMYYIFIIIIFHPIPNSTNKNEINKRKKVKLLETLFQLL